MKWIDEGLERFIFVLVHLEEPVPSLLEVVASHCKVSWMTLDFGVDVLDCGAHHTPEATGSGAALAFKSSHSLTTGISQICDVISRSKSPMMKVICDVMRSSFPFAGWRRFFSGVGFIYLFKLSLIKLSL